ncbi:MAG: ABC transporter permease subunit [Paenibacillus macerans]|uniref:ABC transporter permease subunit n=3 Tax=Paenibacillus macerans TaxID=44252 RepID=A0A090ZW19_PAEMA|nr:ABC transporter permease subunit [Paenibacillus macerans]KFN08346.1 ABC-2 transporter family protein [Paenibacillus macerans]MBS5913900.1 ABC transporter permease subunit [Paenibacillus macerans]MCY7561910.1 ABC transporter permease [Paenibacillus macerans]MDU5947235.1 ABC transporter permease subunit [Paenibacillus macerans]MDU7474066.1 ABC transporter permease subunit [Paenibacillus macerans]
MRIIWAMTWKELLRKRVLLLTFLMTAVFLIGFWFIAGAIGGDVSAVANNNEELIQQFTTGMFILLLGFFFAGFVLAFLAIFSSFSAIAGEAEQGVMQAMLPRPIPRWKWYTGRWLGYVSLGVLYALILYSQILWITDIHAAIPRDPVVLVQAFLLFASVVPLLVTVSMFGSGYLSSVANGVVMTMLYGAGWLGGMIGKIAGSIGLKPEPLQTLNNVAGVLQLIMPADALQRKMQAVLFSFEDISGLIPVGDTGPFGIGEVPSTAFLIYTIFYTAVLFWIGLRRFVRKDL